MRFETRASRTPGADGHDARKEESMRKFFLTAVALLFAAAVIFTGSYVYLTSEAASVTISAASVRAYANRSVSVAVKIDSNSNFSNIRFRLRYDSSNLKLVSVGGVDIGESVLMQANTQQSGVIDVGLISAEGITQTGTLAVVEFMVQSPPAGTVVPLNIDVVELQESSGKNISFSTQDGSVTILQGGGAEIPDPPQGLKYTSATKNSVSVSWNSVSGATGYNVYLNGVKRAYVTSTSYTCTGLTSNTRYCIEVSAVSSTGESNVSASLYVTTPVSAGSGDVNESGRVDIADVMLVFQYVSGMRTADADFLTLADVNSDGGVNIADVMIIFQYVAGMRDSVN